MSRIFEDEIKLWLAERTIEEALEEADITEAEVLLLLLLSGRITLPPWIDCLNDKDHYSNGS